MSRLTECPNCESSVRTCWTDERMLQQECRGDYFDDGVSCYWVGKPFKPTKKPIQSVKTVQCNGSWEYEGFDQYGQTFVMSRGFSSKKVCEAEALKEIQKTSKIPAYGICTAVIWPPTVKARGTVIKLPKSKSLVEKR